VEARSDWRAASMHFDAAWSEIGAADVDSGTIRKLKL
jgi:hypothetical protein